MTRSGRALGVVRRLDRTSLQARLLLISMGLVAAGLLVGGTIVTNTLHRYLLGQVDKELQPLATVAARLPPNVFDALGQSPRQEIVDAGLDLVVGPYLAYVGPGGSVERVARPSTRADGVGPDLAGLDRTTVARHAGRPFEVADREGAHAWRVIAVPRSDAGVAASDPPPAGSSVVVATSLRQVDATIGRLRVIFALTGGVLLAALAVAGWFAIRAGLRPLRGIEETAAAIAGGDLSHRVPDLAGPRTEVGRLSAALNGMLAQVERAFAARADSEARMRRFVADVSHELRTPLFGVKGSTELYRMGALSSQADVDHTMRRIESESSRLVNLTEDLLLLARLDEGSGPGAVRLHLGPMDLRTLAADALHDLRALDPTRSVDLTGPAAGPGVGLGVGPATPAPVVADEARLRQVVANLVGNVIAHTSAGTRVRIGVGTVGARAVLEVADNGPGLTPERAARVFDRFYRADSSRSRADGRTGSGLGLAIAQSLVTAHGGLIELRTAPGQGATFRIVLAAVPDGCDGSTESAGAARTDNGRHVERAADSPRTDAVPDRS